MSVLKTSSDIKDHKDLIFDICEREGVKSFTVSFEGSGDSGQIEDVGLDGKIRKLPVEGAKVSEGTQWLNGNSTAVYRKATDLEDLITSVCYEVLESVCGGWENNDGAYGEFFFDVKKRKVQLDFNERVMESNYTEYRF
jgi:hypothetical protein